MNDERGTLLNKADTNQEDNVIGIFLLILFGPPALLIGLLLFSSVKDYIQASKQVCDLTIYVSNQPQVYKVKRSTITETELTKQVSFVDEVSKQEWSFSNVPYSTSNCHIQ